MQDGTSREEIEGLLTGGFFSARLANPSTEIQSEQKFAQEIVNSD
jgi:hypothetical protein